MLLLDLELTGINAWEILEAVKAKPDACKIIVLHTTKDRDSILRAFYAGADAYLTKDITETELHHTITEVMKDGFAITQPQFKLMM